MRIPHHELSPDTLDALIEEFVTRDGTDLTEAPRSVDQVRRLLDAGKAVIAFDEDTESCNILLREDAKPVIE
ncbi:MAG: YheU family protein [Planctomycetota bacterium]